MGTRKQFTPEFKREAVQLLESKKYCGVASCIKTFCGAGLPADLLFGSPLLSFPPSVRLT